MGLTVLKAFTGESDEGCPSFTGQMTGLDQLRLRCQLVWVHELP